MKGAITATQTMLLVLAATVLGGCDLVQQRLGLEDPAKAEAKADAEGRAVGSACRQSGRAIEDCYSLYHWLPKASVFAGWREMNDYMLANNLGIVEPKLPPPPPPETKRNRTKAKPAAQESAAKADAASAEGEKKAAQ